ncbi:tRNA (adenosine(37)-N6)-threonylcarbamoyltransferase complex dimerization subunit type 1 TsaB [Vannielia litorea]|uniref:tRNA (adenosine(37)-N6)-threonylcarbamoyltransferase complex dimerization subunit type 1 TsaB n=1 Tax=Vannielia litorea TaxID=1217970 RepID=UPI001BD19BD8|nr:tRNA (adenosine(37)-N6)-threonylcarbamoyltransferase complex dimerization subunit type 1 TsaB [Vannielia litorea]MBS8228901.1 tRNA (adenosine(37)-N6)-threonylcarbamoyltransferase complex dimerization subunit type 1 TsaB [Vannielia litorea]
MGVADPTLLAFDTSGPHIAAAVMHNGAVVAQRHEPMKRGQAENLMPILEALLAEAGLAWPDLTALAVGIGPGNFTGIRISVAAARGLALALKIPAVGVTTFELMRDEPGPAARPAELVSLEAPRGMAYVHLLRYGNPAEAPRLIDPAHPPQDLAKINLEVRGFRAEDIAAPFNAPAHPASLEDIPRRLAERAAWLLFDTKGDIPRPAPFYVRAPDAAPARDAPPEIVE